MKTTVIAFTRTIFPEINISLVLFLFLLLGIQKLSADNNAIEFNPYTDPNNDDQYIEAPNSTSLNFNSSFTIMLWAQAHDNRTAKLVEKETWNSGWTVGQDKWNGWKGGFVNTNGTGYQVGSYKKVPNYTQLYHIALSYDGSYLRLFVDGVAEDSVPATGSLKTNTQALSIGADGGGSQKFFKGLIDEVQIWKDALTQEEINAIKDNYISPSSIPSTLNWNDLVAYYKMDEAITSNTITDHSSNSNNGTLMNMIPVDARVPSTIFDGDGSNLPITLINFYAEQSNNMHQLHWTTGSEINNSHFVVQQSNDGISYFDIALIEGHGNSNTPLSYSYSLTNPLTQNTYFRLKQVDFDGTASIFQSIVVQPISNNTLQFTQLSYNGNQLSIQVKTSSQKLNFQLYDLQGKLVKQQEINSENSSIQIPFLSGVYVVVVQSASQRISKKILL